MRLAALGLLIGIAIFVLTGGRVLFLPLLFVLPLGGVLAGGRRRRR